jgi:hypothetical protein
MFHRKLLLQPSQLDKITCHYLLLFLRGSEHYNFVVYVSYLATRILNNSIHDFRRPIANLTVCKKKVYYVGTKLYNSLPV